MSFTSIVFFIASISISLGVLSYSVIQKRFIVGFLSLAFLLRVSIVLALESGLKYYFVIDSLKYEQDGWLVAKSWITGYQDFVAQEQQMGIYTYINGLFFYLFGNDYNILTLLNAVIGTLATLVLIHLFQRHISPLISQERRDHSLFANWRPEYIFAALVTLYPSLMIWTTTNTKDPLFILFSSIFILLILEIKRAFNQRDLISGSVYSFLSLPVLYFIYELRFYGSAILVFTVALSSVLILLKNKLSTKSLSVLFVAFSVATASIVHILFPSIENFLIEELISKRMSFTNIGLDDVAQSSFLLGARITNIFDLFWFIPCCLIYYFFGPFPWSIKNSVQLAGLVESLAVWAAVIPFFRGFRFLLKKNESLAVFLMCVLLANAVVQASIISNLGTIFRHRSFAFCILLAITTVGLFPHKNESASKKITGDL